jgi:RNA polymerase sigma-70 factor, ECF subfamily
VAWEELSYDEAANVMGCSRGAFALRLHRARRQIAFALEATVYDRRPAQPVPNETGT